jgi:hypothetical protein
VEVTKHKRAANLDKAHRLQPRRKRLHKLALFFASPWTPAIPLVPRIDLGRCITNHWIPNRREEDPDVSQTRFWNCHRLLHFIACRVLGGPERASDAVENCWQTACQNPPRFESEGAFRSWLARVLMDEALAILHQRHKSADGVASQRRDSSGARNQIPERPIVLPKAAAEGEY